MSRSTIWFTDFETHTLTFYTHAPTCAYNCILGHRHLCTHSHVCNHTHTYMQSNVSTCTRSHTCAYTYRHTHGHTLTRVCTQSPKCTVTHTFTHVLRPPHTELMETRPLRACCAGTVQQRERRHNQERKEALTAASDSTGPDVS